MEDYEKIWGIKVDKSHEGEEADLSLGPNGETSLFQFTARDIDGRIIDFSYALYFFFTKS